MPKPQITILGHVGRDPKMGTTNAGTPFATFPVAENHWRWDGMARQWLRTGTSWFHVTCRWGLAEHAAESLKTGDPVIVAGKVRIAEWFDGNGVKQVTADVDATSVGHDLRRGTAKFSRVEPGTMKAPADEDAEIRGHRDEPPGEPPDPFTSSSNGSQEPPADPPADAVDDTGGDPATDAGPTDQAPPPDGPSDLDGNGGFPGDYDDSTLESAI